MIVFDDLFSKIKTITNDITDGATVLFDDAERLINRSFDKHISIGVTGFSGSGKSTFMTSLIHQLRYSNDAGINGFQPARDEKVIEVNLLPVPGHELFDYQAGISALASQPPAWPEPTSGLTGCIIQIVYKRESVVNALMGDTTTLNIELLDYPGEWLLDLPLMDLYYWNWSIENTELTEQGQRNALMGDLLVRLQSLSPFEILSDAEIDDLFKQFSSYLVRCKKVV